MTEKDLKTGYRETDSWAYWKIPEGLKPTDSAEKAEELFKKDYKPGFPEEYRDKVTPDHLKNVKYVLITLNPGNSAIANGSDFNNFHGEKKSNDWRFAAAIYGTKVWGAFMTDLIQTHESNSENVSINKENVLDLAKHLDDLGIPKSAVLIVAHSKAYDFIKRYMPAERSKIFKMQHYSGANNGHWNTAEQHQVLENIVKEAKN